MSRETSSSQTTWSSKSSAADQVLFLTTCDGTTALVMSRVSRLDKLGRLSVVTSGASVHCYDLRRTAEILPERALGASTRSFQMEVETSREFAGHRPPPGSVRIPHLSWCPPYSSMPWGVARGRISLSGASRHYGDVFNRHCHRHRRPGRATTCPKHRTTPINLRSRCLARAAARCSRNGRSHRRRLPSSVLAV